MSEPITHLWIEEPQEVGDQLLLTATLESAANLPTSSLWYRVRQVFEAALNPHADTFVVGTLFTAMRIGHPVHVHGTVSSSLLRNLEEFQAVWARWYPSRYTAVDITADRESTDFLSSQRDRAIFGFSGGVDSTFTLYRHFHKLAGRRSRNLGAGLLVHGFDVALSEQASFDAISNQARLLLSQFGIELISIATNFRELGDVWEDAHGAGLAACLMLFSNSYAAGIIGSTSPYYHLYVPWGSSPITDHLLSSDYFSIVHDGAEYPRTEKIAEIGNWDVARNNLRVCWQGLRGDANCCKCEKCIRTILAFRLLGFDLPPCFQHDVTDDDILALRGMDDEARWWLIELLEEAHARNLDASWVTALQTAVGV
jgi:hypothetical protein